MHEEYKLLSPDEVDNVFRSERFYSLARNANITCINEYLNLASTNNPNKKLVIIKRNDLQLDVTYCDQTIVIDCSEIVKIDGDFYTCIQAYKEKKELDIKPTDPKFEKVGCCLYSKGQTVYLQKEGKMVYGMVGLLTGLNNYILETLLHVFD